MFALLLVYRLYYSYIGAAFIGEQLDVKQMLMNSRIVPNAVMLIAIAVWMHMKKVSLHELGFAKMHKEGFAGCFYFLPLVVLLLVVVITMNPYVPMDATMWAVAIMELLLVAIFEEVLFRGIFFRALLPYRNLSALFGTAILFTIGHMGNWSEFASNNTELFLYAVSSLLFYLPISLMFSYLRFNAKSIIPCIIYHALHNLVIANVSFDILYLSAFFAAYAYAMHLYNKRKEERIV
ncbi:hypothetical protein A4S06_05890 [Erysipelotrichaceae bacterium MTC7]|nr:hypothetical protein A4S06_05890 [Erysipelotrichaceae bacterium MTC7]